MSAPVPGRPTQPTPTVIVLMGVAGAGKTTVGERLATALGWPFADADDYHSPDNVARMRRGEGLTDAQRAPWLQALAALIAEHVARGAPLVLACSALRRSYRSTLAPDALGAAVRFAHLRVSPATLAARLGARAGHYASGALLASQLATLEPPEPDEDVLVLDGERMPDEIVATLRAALGV